MMRTNNPLHIHTTLIVCMLFLCACPGCRSEDQEFKVPDLVPQKKPAGGGMLGLAMNDFFKKLKDGRRDVYYVEKYLKMADNPDDPWEKDKWENLLISSYRAYMNYNTALYNYSAFKDGSPVDNEAFNERAAEIACIGREALPEMLAAVVRMAKLKNRTFHKLNERQLYLQYWIERGNHTKPFVEYPIDPLEELRTRMRASDGLLEGYREVLKEHDKEKQQRTERLLSWKGPYPYKMLIRECRWLLSLVHEHDMPEAFAIVMEIESRLPEIEKISEGIWEKIGGKERAKKLHEKLLKKDRFHKLEYMLTRHFERDKKKCPITDKEIEAFYSGFKMEREKLKDEFSYAEWVNELNDELPVKSFTRAELIESFRHTLHHVPQLIWESPVRIRKTKDGQITLRTFRWTSINITICWGESRTVAQEYMIGYLTRPSVMKGEEIKKSTGEIGDACYYRRKDLYGKKDSIAYLNFIRDNIVVLVTGVGMSAERCLKFSKAIDDFIQNQPEFKYKTDTYNDWFSEIKNLNPEVTVNNSIPVNIPPVPEANLKSFCLELDTHSYIMEKDAKFTCHGWEAGGGKIAVGLLNRENGEIVRYEKVTVQVLPEADK